MLIRAEWKWKRERRDVQLTFKVASAVGSFAKQTKCRVLLEREEESILGEGVLKS